MTRSGRTACGLASALALLLPVSASSQVLRGRVLADSAGVMGADVLVSDSTGVELRTQTDGLGLFAVDLPTAGRYRVSARHEGHAPAGPEIVDVGEDEEVMLLIRMATMYALSPIEVSARRRYVRSPVLAALEERLAWSERLGFGRVLRREELERIPATDVRDLLMGTPGLRVARAGTRYSAVVIAGAGGSCTPQVYVDGVRDVTRQGSLDTLSPADLETVEIYRSSLESPPEYVDPGGCGVILFWTRRNPAGGKPVSWKRLLVLAGAVGLMILSVR